MTAGQEKLRQPEHLQRLHQAINRLNSRIVPAPGYRLDINHVPLAAAPRYVQELSAAFGQKIDPGKDLHVRFGFDETTEGLRAESLRWQFQRGELSGRISRREHYYTGRIERIQNGRLSPVPDTPRPRFEPDHITELLRAYKLDPYSGGDKQPSTYRLWLAGALDASNSWSLNEEMVLPISPGRQVRLKRQAAIDTVPGGDWRSYRQALMQEESQVCLESIDASRADGSVRKGALVVSLLSYDGQPQGYSSWIETSLHYIPQTGQQTARPSRQLPRRSAGYLDDRLLGKLADILDSL